MPANPKIRKTVSLCLALLFAAVLTAAGCAQSDYYVGFSLSSDFYVDGGKLSDSEWSQLQGEISDILHQTEDAVDAEGGGDLARIGDAGTGVITPVGEHVRTLLSLSQTLYEETGGAFSPALYNLSDLWGFSPSHEGRYGEPRPEPSAEAITEAMANSQFSDITLCESGVVKANAATRLDLGGIAKGYMCDLIYRHLLNKYVGRELNGTFSVMSSGTVLIGLKITASGSRGYTASIENPRRVTTNINEAAFLVGLSDVVLSTSADTYRFYAHNGQIYSHIIDPHTGKPSENGVISITVIVPLSVPYAGALADAYSTAGFCMPLTDALAFYEEQALQKGIGAVVITSDFKYYVVGDYQVLTRREYAELTKPGIADTIEDVFVRTDVAQANDVVIPCEKEQEYIAYVEERSK